MIRHDNLGAVRLGHAHVHEIGRHREIVEMDDLWTKAAQEVCKARHRYGRTGVNRAALLPVRERRQHMHLSICMLVSADGLSWCACLMKSDG